MLPKMTKASTFTLRSVKGLEMVDRAELVHQTQEGSPFTKKFGYGLRVVEVWKHKWIQGACSRTERVTRRNFSLVWQRCKADGPAREMVKAWVEGERQSGSKKAPARADWFIHNWADPRADAKGGKKVRLCALGALIKFSVPKKDWPKVLGDHSPPKGRTATTHGCDWDLLKLRRRRDPDGPRQKPLKWQKEKKKKKTKKATKKAFRKK